MAKKSAPQPSYMEKMSKTEALKQLKDTLFFQMQNSKNKLGESIQKLNENYYYYFSWVGIDALESDINYHLLKRVHDPILEAYESVADYESKKSPYFDAYEIMYANITQNKEFCSRAYNVRSASTSELSNITSTAEFKMRLELIEFFGKTLRWYTKETDLSDDDRKVLDDIRFRVENPSYAVN